MHYLIAPARIFRASADRLTYASATPLLPGQIVVIPLGRQKTLGLVLEKTTAPQNFKAKPIERLLFPEPLPANLLRALLWLADYYRCPLATVIQCALPSMLQKTLTALPKTALSTAKTPQKPPIPGNTEISPNSPVPNTAEPPLPLNRAQRNALTAIRTNPNHTVLLHGITGSGKTNIYIQLAKDTVAHDQSVILLVPEIALTSQLVQNFQRHFRDVTLLHSRQTDKTRFILWQQLLQTGDAQTPAPRVVIGPRSALFAPLANLGLIIIDEAHEPAYRQDQSPKYSALRLSAKLAKTLLGTATPPVQDYYLCQKRHAVVTLNELAVPSAKTTAFATVDLKDRALFTKSRILSNPLLEDIKNSLLHHRQAMLFHNRRGTAPLTVCDRCGWQALCPHCLLPLVLHDDRFKMCCHNCGRSFPVPTVCPECGSAGIHHKGFGTKQIETELTRLFPQAKIARFDADSDPKLTLDKIYDAVKDGAWDIIVGTQTIAKGFDFPKLATLGIVQADAGLSLPDYSAEERVFQLITQVIGRAKRGHQNSKIFIQSFRPDHPIIRYASAGDYTGFYNYLIHQRQKSQLPPYAFLLKLSVTFKTETVAVAHARELYKKVIQLQKSLRIPPEQFAVTPPMPAFHEHSRSGYTWQLVVKAKSRDRLQAVFDRLPRAGLRYDFDPVSLL